MASDWGAGSGGEGGNRDFQIYGHIKSSPQQEYGIEKPNYKATSREAGTGLLKRHTDATQPCSMDAMLYLFSFQVTLRADFKKTHTEGHNRLPPAIFLFFLKWYIHIKH